MQRWSLLSKITEMVSGRARFEHSPYVSPLYYYLPPLVPLHEKTKAQRSYGVYSEAQNWDLNPCLPTAKSLSFLTVLRHGPQTSSLNATWEHVRNANLLIYISGMGSSNLWFKKPSKWFWCKLKVGEALHCIKLPSAEYWNLRTPLRAWETVV